MLLVPGKVPCVSFPVGGWHYWTEVPVASSEPLGPALPGPRPGNRHKLLPLGVGPALGSHAQGLSSPVPPTGPRTPSGESGGIAPAEATSWPSQADSPRPPTPALPPGSAVQAQPQPGPVVSPRDEAHSLQLALPWGAQAAADRKQPLTPSPRPRTAMSPCRAEGTLQVDQVRDPEMRPLWPSGPRVTTGSSLEQAGGPESEPG